MRPLIALVLLAVLHATPGSAEAQQPAAAAAYVGRVITSITVTIEGRATTDSVLLDLIETRQGTPLRMADVRETITHLYSLSRFEDVQVEAEDAGPGVSLHYVLQPIHGVTRVEFRGTLGLSGGTLRERMVERFGPNPPVGRAADVASTLEALYRDRGYMRASVRPAPPIIRHDPDRATLVFDVSSGPRALIHEVSVTGTPLDSTAEVTARLGIAPGRPYDPGELQRRLAAYVDRMRHRGYYEAAATRQARLSGDATSVDLTIEVRPGPAVTVRFEGDPLPKDRVADLVPIEREGSVNEDLLEDSARRIEDYFRQQGYWKARVDQQRQEAPNRLTIVFRIDHGPLYHVAPGGVEISGNQSVPLAEFKDAFKLLPGDPFVTSKLDATVAGIRQTYLARGFPDPRIDAQASEVAAGLVKPVIVIKEGTRVVVGSVTIEGNQGIRTETLLRTMKTRPGAAYSGADVRNDVDAIVLEYLNAGYASAKVDVAPVMSPDGTRADLHFKVQEGPQTIVDHILVVGNTRTDEAVILREMQLRPGQPLGLADLLESRQRLSALGLFRRVHISELPPSTGNNRDVLVTVEEALRTTIGFGGGAEVDKRLQATGPGGQARERFEFAPRGFFEVGRRNLGGRNRSVNLYSRLSLRPNNDPNDPKRFGFTEYRVVGTYREPDALHGHGDLTGTAAIEQGVRTSFNFARKGFNAELARRLSSSLRGSARYSFGTTRLFNEQLSASDPLTPLIDRLFPQVRLSAFSAAVARDTRDDLLEPQNGTFVTVDGTIAARSIGSEVGFAKTFLQGYVYHQLGRPHLVFAGGARLGLANPFPRTVQSTDAEGNPLPQVVQDLPASERFFAGGDTTIRGYALDSVGTPETINAQGFPIGGNALLVLNAELRAPLWRELGGALFVDGGNVFARASDFDLTELRGGIGFGLRYRSPIGPVRLDLGFKMDRRVLGGRLEPRTALHFSIGQAF